MTLTLQGACLAIVDCEHKTAPTDPDGEYYAVGTPAMRGNRIDYDQARRISYETFLAWTRRLTPQPGDLLFAREAPVGPIVRIPNSGRVAPGQRTVLLRPNPDTLDSAFAYYLLSSPLQRLRLLEKAEGSTVPHLNVADVRSFELPELPPVDEQRSIAAVLGALDDKVESGRRLIQHSHELLDAMAGTWCASLPTTPLSSLSGLTRATVNPAALGNAVVDHHSLPAFDTSGRPERVPASTIMSNKIGLTGTCVLVSRLNPRTNRTWWAIQAGSTAALASTEFAVLSASTELELAAIWLAVRHPSFLEELPRRVTGTSGSHQRVRPDDMLAIEVPDVRQLDDATKETALSLLQLAHQRREEMAALSELRDALLPELLSGRIRLPEVAVVIQDDRDESESA